MKKTIKLAVVAALALGTTSVFATNGANLIGIGAKSRGMGGTSIGVSHGAESALSNPALITSVENTEISFGGTIFMPDVSSSATGSTGLAGVDSAADMNVIPAVSIASKINDNFYFGIGMWGTAGMGVDYRDTVNTSGQMQMVTNLQLMQFGVPLAYKANNFSIAITPLLQYGSLDFNWDNGTPSTTKGLAQDLKFGYNLGLSYEIADFTIGAVYKSQIDMEYKGQLSVALPTFGLANKGDKLSTPAEYGIGASYAMGEHTIAIDYKNIQWSDTEGYGYFGWDDQDVIAVGYEYATKGWALRAGVNHASNPIKDMIGVTTANGYSLNTLNILGFPGIIETHYTIGGTYNVSEQTSVDLAYVYGASNSQKLNVSPTATSETTHSQTGVSLALNYAF